MEKTGEFAADFNKKSPSENLERLGVSLQIIFCIDSFFMGLEHIWIHEVKYGTPLNTHLSSSHDLALIPCDFKWR